MAQIREIMTLDLVALEKDATCSEAAEKMRDAGVGDVIVTDNGKPFGIVTDRDIATRAVAEHKNPDEVRVSDICSKELKTLSPEDDEEEAISLMREKAVRRILIVEEERPVGIVSLGDLAQRRDPRSVLGQVSAAPPSA